MLLGIIHLSICIFFAGYKSIIYANKRIGKRCYKKYAIKSILYQENLWGLCYCIITAGTQTASFRQGTERVTIDIIHAELIKNFFYLPMSIVGLRFFMEHV